MLRVGRWTAIAIALGVPALAGSGCATTTSHVTWDQVAASDDGAPAASATAATFGGGGTPQASVGQVAEVHRGPPVGLLVDRALAAFQSRRAVARSLPKTSAAHSEMWEDVLSQIDDACQGQPSGSDLGAFVRARVTLEVELDSDLRRGVLLPGDLAKRVQRTLAFVDRGVHELRLARAEGTLAPVPRLRDGQLVLRAPVAPMFVSSPFGVRWDPIEDVRRFHAGVDISAPEGTMVYAAASGVVVYAGWQGGYGRHVVLDHGDGIRTHYSHMNELFVKPGALIDEGDTLGGVGSTGRSTGPHLHFAVTSGDGRFHDPMKLLDVPLDAALGNPVAADLSGGSVDFDKVEMATPISTGSVSVAAKRAR